MDIHCQLKSVFVVIVILLTQNVLQSKACNRFCFEPGRKQKQSSCLYMVVEKNKCTTQFIKPHDSDSLTNVQSIAQLDIGCVKLWSSRDCVGSSEMVFNTSPQKYDLNKLPIRDFTGRYWAKNIRSVSGCGFCGNNSFVCDNKRCIPRSYLCDGFNHCGDGSDERNCLDLPIAMASFRKCESVT